MDLDAVHPEAVNPEALRPHYRRFLRPNRILLTGHSHQAWPDVAEHGLLESFEDAALHVDDKWARAEAAANAVRAAVSAQLGGAAEDIALAPSSHELCYRFLSALDLTARPHLVTTRGEFHSVRRQLTRLAEEGVDVTWVPVDPLLSLAGRLADAVTPRTAAVLASSVLYARAAIVPGLDEAVEAAMRVGAEVLLDAYHAFQALPQAVLRDPRVFVTGGGYKYAQWGEGNCFMRVPARCRLRPVQTGWFAEFSDLEQTSKGVAYASAGAMRFAGSTYEPASHYRARRVVDFFAEQGLSLDRLRATSLRQTARILEGIGGRLEIVTPHAPARRGAFVAVRVPEAPKVVRRLRAQGVYVDARDDILRIGPAPYTTDDEIDEALRLLRAQLS